MTKPKGPISDQSTVLGTPEADTDSDVRKQVEPISDKSTVMGGGGGGGGKVPDTLAAPPPSRPSGGTSGAFPWKEGDKVGPEDRWVLLEPLGKGGSGTVWMARDLRYKKERALKFVDLSDEGAAAQFKNEAHLAQDVLSEHVMRTFDPVKVQDGAGGWWGVLPQEVGKGTTLDWVIRQLEPHGGPTPDEIRRILRGALKGLDAIHQAGLIHRDIKPENLIVRGWDPARRNVDDVVIIDLGTCVRAGGGPDQMQYPIVGTPGYWAPELQGNAQFANRSTDLYSLGVTAMVAATHGADPRTWSKPLTDHGALLDRLGPDLRVSILKAVVHKSSERPYAVAADWLADLEPKVAAPPVAPARPKPAARKTAPPQPKATPSMMAWLVVIGLLGICGVGVVGVAGTFMKNQPVDDAPPQAPVVVEETTPVDVMGEVARRMDEGKGEPRPEPTTPVDVMGEVARRMAEGKVEPRSEPTPPARVERTSEPATPKADSATPATVLGTLADRWREATTPTRFVEPTSAPATPGHRQPAATHQVHGVAGEAEPWLHLRTGPNKSILGRLSEGTALRLVVDHGDWLEVEVLEGDLRGRQGWVFARFIQRRGG
jgi:hypothetical protein